MNKVDFLEFYESIRQTLCEIMELDFKRGLPSRFIVPMCEKWNLAINPSTWDAFLEILLRSMISGEEDHVSKYERLGAIANSLRPPTDEFRDGSVGIMHGCAVFLRHELHPTKFALWHVDEPTPSVMTRGADA
jgi:hypothetical protein